MPSELDWYVLASVAQLVGHYAMHQNIASSIPGQRTSRLWILFLIRVYMGGN